MNNKKQEAIKGIKEDVRKEVFRWLNKWKLYIIGGFSIASIFGFIIMCHYIYKTVTKNTAKFISNSVAVKFAEPTIKQTLNDVAMNQAKVIIEKEVNPGIKQIKQYIEKELTSFNEYINDFKTQSEEEYNVLNNEIKKIRKEIVRFKKYLDNTKAKYSSEYEELEQQVKILEKRSELTRLADKAIANGDSKAFEDLKKYTSQNVSENISDTAKAELLRVKKFYIGMTRIKGRDISYKGLLGRKYTGDEISTSVLIKNLKTNSDWRVRVKSAELLGKRKEENIAKVLLKAVKEDENLNVRKEALDAFEKVSGYQSSDVLDYKPALEWWEENKKEIELEFKDKNK